METAVALGAIRRITIDVANLTGQLAVMQSGVEYVRQVAAGVIPQLWDREMRTTPEGEHPEMIVVLREEQADAIMRLLAALDALE